MIPIEYIAYNIRTKILVDLKKITPFALDSNYKGDGLFLPFDSEIMLLQFSGMLDKKKQKIYHKDVCELIDADGNVKRVVCEFGIARRQLLPSKAVCDIFGFHFRDMESGHLTFPIVENYAGVHDLNIIERIGNIHMNDY